MILRYIPNILTLMRLLLIVPFLLSLYHHYYRDAFYFFLIAGLTDALDGWLARAFNWQSYFGSFIDPLADKLLIASSFISLALAKQLPWWLVILVFARDLTISLGVVAWYKLIKLRLEFQPTFVSKINTVLQLALVIICLFSVAFDQHMRALIQLLIGLTTLTTACTYLNYTWRWGKKAYLNVHAAS